MYKWICLSFLALLTGCGTPSFLITPVKSTSNLEEVELESGSGWNPAKVVIVPIDGMLTNSQTGGLLAPSENPMSLFQQQLDYIASDPSVKAVVLRVNSPGGTVTCSDAIYTLLLRFKARTHIPVVASTQEVCASGAYYISCAADKIVAQPTSVVGSIGVIFETFDATGTMKMLGVKIDPVKSAAHKDIGSPFKPQEPEERAIMQSIVDEYFARFKSVVKEHRTIKPEDWTMVTDGRVFSGEKAMQLGLVDQTGLLEDAIALAKKMANTPNAKVVSFRRPFAYSGSIYASSPIQSPQANVLMLQLPGERSVLPTGFYYVWQP